MRQWLALGAALILMPLALGYTIFGARATEVRCTRASGPVSCAEREHIGPYDVWAKSVEDIQIARDMSG